MNRNKRRYESFTQVTPEDQHTTAGLSPMRWHRRHTIRQPTQQRSSLLKIVTTGTTVWALSVMRFACAMTIVKSARRLLAEGHPADTVIEITKGKESYHDQESRTSHR
jgi:hypothetical protein